jgi:signal transduction histidine kinase
MNFTDVFGAQFPYLFTSSFAISVLLFMLPQQDNQRSALRMASFGFLLVATSSLILTLTQNSGNLYLRGFALMLALLGISCLFLELSYVLSRTKLIVIIASIVATFGVFIFFAWLQSPLYFARLIIIDTLFALSLGSLGYFSQKLNPRQYATSRLILGFSAYSFAAVSLLRIAFFIFLSDQLTFLFFFAYSYVSVGVFAIFGLGFGFALTHIERVTFEIKLKNAENIELLREVREKKNQLEGVKNFITHEIVRPINAAKSLCRSIGHGAVQSSNSASIFFPEDTKLRLLEKELNSAMAQIQAVRDFDDVESLLDDVSLSNVDIREFFSSTQSRWDVLLELHESTLGRFFKIDSFLLDIAIDNIIENAFKFGAGGVRLTVWCDEPSVCHIDVIDNGSGIPPCDWESVWRIYYRGSGVTSAEVHGSGLGMFLVSKILRAHDGSARVVSNSPSAIRMSLPCH